MSDPLKVVVTGAAGQIGYSILYMIASGAVFGSRKVILHLLDITPCMGTVGGVVMELHDCAFPTLAGVVPTDDPAVAFNDVDAAFLIGAFPRKEGMERKDLLAANIKIFKAQGGALDQHAKKSVKVLVVGNPANTNALICSKYAPSIPKENFSAMTRLDQNRAKSQIAAKLNVNAQEVKNVIIWGNHSSTQFPDAKHATVGDKTVPAALGDDNWLQGDFVSIVQKRGAAVIAARKLSSAMSAANAACDHMRDWFLGTPDGEFTSMGVISDGSYNIPQGIIYSYPVTCKDGKWTIRYGLGIDSFARAKMDETAKELVEERDEAIAVCA
jgi:malate dehydrogenase